MSDTTATLIPTPQADIANARLRSDAGKGSELANLVMDLHNRDHAEPAFYCHPACQMAERELVHG